MLSHVFLSVILSTYNEEKYIAESISSILAQTYPFFELIVVNDGSTDGTLEIIKSFSDPRIVVIDKPNTGLPDSLNQGIKTAKYDWIARMDGDDIAEPDRFEKQVAKLTENIGIVGGQFKTIGPEGQSLSSTISSKPLSSLKCKMKLMLGMSPLTHPAVIFRKSLIEKYGGYDTNFRAAQDLELWLRLAPDTQMVNIPDVVLRYRKHGNTITSQKHDLQMKLTFLGYLKYILKIRKPLSEEEFESFEAYFSGIGLIAKNQSLFDKSHNKTGVNRYCSILCYYAWRTWILIRFRLTRRNVLVKITPAL